MDMENWKKTVEFHGHECPGLAIGYKAAEAAKEKLGIDFSTDEEIVCVSENDACGVDAIQFLTGCTAGKGNLVFRGTGKMAYSFFCRNSGKSIRMVLKPFSEKMDRRQRQDYILNAASDELFDFGAPKYPVPEPARLFESVMCEICGEMAPEHRIRLSGGKKVCLDCFIDYNRGWDR